MKSRQKIRKGILLFAFFLFPAVFFYMSPVIIIEATLKGIVNGSFIMFLIIFLSSLILGRACCGWICPAAGCQEAIFLSRDKKVTKGYYIKWFIWIPWISAIIFFAIKGGGYQKIDFFYRTNHGFSVGDLNTLIVYFLILFFLVVFPSFIFGKRSFCHHLCWAAPFMIIGRTIRNKVKWASLQLQADPEKCNHCHSCSENCPMSLPVESMVTQNKMENPECILCGACVDDCKAKAVKFTFR